MYPGYNLAYSATAFHAPQQYGNGWNYPPQQHPQHYYAAPYYSGYPGYAPSPYPAAPTVYGPLDYAGYGPTSMAPPPLPPQPLPRRKLRKPDVSLTEIIASAILEKEDQRATLREIYAYMVDKYDYYRVNATQKTWRNSVRHHLYIYRCFVKTDVKVRHGQHYWTIHDDLLTSFMLGQFNSQEASRKIAGPNYRREQEAKKAEQENGRHLEGPHLTAVNINETCSTPALFIDEDAYTPATTYANGASDSSPQSSVTSPSAINSSPTPEPTDVAQHAAGDSACKNSQLPDFSMAEITKLADELPDLSFAPLRYNPTSDYRYRPY